MKPVLHEAMCREYDCGVANCSVETAASIAAPAELTLNLMPIMVEDLELSMAGVCVDRLDLAAAATAGGTFGARSEPWYNLAENLVERSEDGASKALFGSFALVELCAFPMRLFVGPASYDQESRVEEPVIVPISSITSRTVDVLLTPSAETIALSW